MPASTKWAVCVALVLIALAIAGGAVWQRQHPATSLPADLAGLLPGASGTANPGASAPSATAPGAMAPGATKVPGAGTTDAAEAPSRQAAAPATKPDDGQGAPGANVPRFDLVRVEPKGGTVVAGTGAPNAKIALLAGGKVLAEGRTDETGQFVLLPPPLAPGDYALTLRQGAGAAGAAMPGGESPGIASAQSVAVSVPKPGAGQLVVALAEPGQPTRLLSPPPGVPAASDAKPAPVAPTPDKTASLKTAPGMTAGVRPSGAEPAKGSGAAPRELGIRSVELENGNGFFASGGAKPGTPVHLYLNQTHLADVVAGADGAWSVTIRKGLAGGHYVVRADAGPGREVTERVEVPFDVPAAMAQAAMAQAAMAKPATTVSPGDSRAPRLASLAPPTDAEATRPRLSDGRARTMPRSGTSASDAPTVGEVASPSSSPEATVPETQNTPPPASNGASAVIEEVQTRQVLGGDNLWKISRERLGYGKRFTQIYAANAQQIRDPALIYPGQIFVLPAK